MWRARIGGCDTIGYHSGVTVNSGLLGGDSEPCVQSFCGDEGFRLLRNIGMC